jgi:DNA mismatch repair ATPase MutL
LSIKLDSKLKKKFDAFKEEFNAIRIRYQTEKGKIITLKNIPAIVIPGEAVIMFNDGTVTTLNWMYVIDVSYALNEKQIRMAVKSAEMAEETQNMFMKDRDKHEPEVG